MRRPRPLPLQQAVAAAIDAAAPPVDRRLRRQSFHWCGPAVSAGPWPLPGARLLALASAQLDLRAEAAQCGPLCLLGLQGPGGAQMVFNGPVEVGFGLWWSVQGSIELRLIDGQTVNIAAGTGLLVDAGQMATARLPPGGSSQLVLVSGDVLEGQGAHAAAAALGSWRRLDPATVGMLDRITQGLLRSVGAQAPLAAAPATWTSLGGALLGLALGARAAPLPDKRLDSHGTPCLLPSSDGLPPALQRVMALMQRQARDDLSLDRLAGVAGIGPRALQQAFKQHCGMSPLACLRELRLQGARQALLAAQRGCTVAAIARHWGFGHAGVFAARYRARFGESPLDTLRRGRPALQGQQADPASPA